MILFNISYVTVNVYVHVSPASLTCADPWEMQADLRGKKLCINKREKQKKKSDLVKMKAKQKTNKEDQRT